MNKYLATAAIVMTLGAANAFAGPIASYTFDSGIDDSLNNYDLGQNGASPDISQQAYWSDGNPDNFLRVDGPGGMPHWTLSLWVNTAIADQGTYKGIFSNQNNPQNAYSWQIDSHNGNYRLLSRGNGNKGIVIGTPTLNVWENIVVQKFNGNNARLFFNGESVQENSPTGFNPGGLQNFRVGINRMGDNSFTGFIDDINIWNDSDLSEKDIRALYEAGPSNSVPVPAPVSLLAFGLAGLMLNRKRHS